MIIIRYLVRETLKSQLAILFILLLIFFCQKLVRILGAAVDGDIPTNLVLSLLGLGIPEMAQLILPLSLFLGLLMTLGKLYTESEITVMHACGLSKAVLIKAAMILALFTGAVAAVNVMWAGPWSSRHQDEVLAEAKANPGMAALAQGQFQQASDGNAVMFIESVNGNRFHDVFLAQLRPKGNARPSVVVADSGELSQQKDGSQVVTLNKGTRFEGTAMLRDFRITDFNNYQAIIGHQAVRRSGRHRTDGYAHPVADPHRSCARRTALALHAGGNGLHYGADGGAAQRGQPAPGPRAVDAAGDAALPGVLPAADLD